MRYLIVFFFFCGFAVANAQSTDSQTQTVTAKKELSDADFIRAKKMYMDMMQTNAYKKSVEARRKFNKGLGNVPFPPQDKVWDWNENQEFLKLWAQQNYANSNFGSAQELTEAYIEFKALDGKYVRENVEVYQLMAQASGEQLEEILAPETERKLNEIINGK